MACRTGACAGRFVDGKIVFGVSTTVMEHRLFRHEGSFRVDEIAAIVRGAVGAIALGFVYPNLVRVFVCILVSAFVWPSFALSFAPSALAGACSQAASSVCSARSMVSRLPSAS